METCSKITAAIAACLIMTANGAAQTVYQEDLERCAKETTANRKLACFEALTLAGKQRREETAVSSTAVEVAAASLPEVIPATELSMDPAVTTGSLTSAPTQSVAGFDERQFREKPIESPPAAIEPIPAIENLVSNQAQNETVEPEVLVASVVKVTKGRFNILTFHFANGQVWRQREARRFQYPKGRDFDVTITKGMMGDDQLRVEGSGAMTRIRRIQ